MSGASEGAAAAPESAAAAPEAVDTEAEAPSSAEPGDEADDAQEQEAEASGEPPEDEMLDLEALGLDVATLFAEPDVEAPEPESEFITGHVPPRAALAPNPAARAVRLDVPREHEPIGGEDDGEGEEFEDEEGEDMQNEDEDEDEDDVEGYEMDALFDLACSAFERDGELEWSEVIMWLTTVEVDDPRLALLATLLADAGQSAAVSGKSVIAALESMQLGEMVAAAKKDVEQSVHEQDDEESEPEPEPERPIVRTHARELREQAARAASQRAPLAGSKVARPGLIGEPDRPGPRPVASKRRVGR